MSVNGYIAFDKPILSNKAEKYPLSGPAINVFHTDLIFTKASNSHMSFQEYTEEDPAIMAMAQFELELFGHQKDFNPNHVIVVTWSNAFKKDTTGRVRYSFLLLIDC